MLKDKTLSKTVLVSAESTDEVQDSSAHGNEQDLESDSYERGKRFTVRSDSSEPGEPDTVSSVSSEPAKSKAIPQDFPGTLALTGNAVMSVSQAREILGERFDVLLLLGQGGMGSVFKVYDRNLKNTFAVKILKRELLNDEASAKRFEKEAKAAMRLTHAHLTAVYEYGRGLDNVPYLLMDYLEGQTLEGLLEHQGPLESSRAVELFLQLSDALDFAHSRGIVHGDIKPSNIMVISPDSQSDYAKLFDFGIARVLNDRCVDMTQEITQAGGLVGSPAFLSPEQCRGKEATVASDIFSLGCVMYKAVTGLHPFEGKSVVETAVNIVTSEPIPFAKLNPSEKVPPSLEKLILRCLSKNPEDRYPTAGQLKADLLRLRSGKRLSVSQKQEKQNQRWSRNIIASVVAGLLLLFTANYLIRNNPVVEELTHGYFLALASVPQRGQKYERPDYPTMMRWAYTHFEEGHYDRAIYLLDRCWRTADPGSDLDPYRVNRLCNGDPDDAEWRKDWKQAAPSVGDGLTSIGICYSRLKKADAAAYYYQNALRLFQKFGNGDQASSAVHGYADVLRQLHKAAAADALEADFRTSGKIESIPRAGSTWKPNQG